ncbi:MAG: hypothetical protein ACLTHL_08145 [Collinsella sp.]|jgi:hypothetical protein|nr:hypothetical protein [Collinsella sp.]
MNISNVISGILSVKETISIFLEFFGFLSLAAFAIGAFSRLGKAAWRFGLALCGKKIMIVASAEDYCDLEEDLSDSGLIKRKNIQRVSDKHISKVKDALLLIVVYGYLDKDGFREIINGKSSRCGLIVHCPPEKGRIDDEEMGLLSKTAFTALCNFRGRLVNDVLLMMLSTSFKKSDLK